MGEWKSIHSLTLAATTRPGRSQLRGIGPMANERGRGPVAPQHGVHALLGHIFGHRVPRLRLLAAMGFAPRAHLPRVAALDGVERGLVVVGRRVGA